MFYAVVFVMILVALGVGFATALWEDRRCND